MAGQLVGNTTRHNTTEKNNLDKESRDIYVWTDIQTPWCEYVTDIFRSADWI